MGVKKCLYVTVLFLMASLCFGIYKGTSYTDISSDDSYLDDIYVAEISEAYAVSACEEFSDALPRVPIVARVTAIEDVEHLARASRQLVQVKTAYRGDALKEGEHFYVTFRNWSLSLYGEPYSMERGFVNVLNIGEDYLVFIENQIDGLGEKIPIYELYGESPVAPVFSYEKHQNKILETGAEHTYVPYSRVKENEFFVESQEALNALETLKDQMINLYL